MIVLSVPANVNEWFAANVLPLAIVIVALVAGAVIATLLILVAVAAPKVGVMSAGEVKDGALDNTTLPLPVDVVTPVPPRATESVPVVPAMIGSPVAFTNDDVLNNSEFVILFVMPLWTIGISSVALAVEAAGSCEMAMVDIIYLSNFQQRC
jgi:hypothetical protein